MTLAPGQVVAGKYQIAEPIDDTGAILRFRALHLGIRRDVEVKVPAASHVADEAALSKLAREARTAGKVAHRNVQSVVDSGQLADGTPFFVFEALEGSTLAEILAESPSGIAVERAANLVIQLLDAVGAVHRGGVIHRAVSPAAIRVVPIRGGDELLKLGQFASAVFEGDQRPGRPTAAGADDAFLAPELRASGMASPSSDLYAVGMVFRALVTGDPTSDAGAPDLVVRAVRRATAPDPHDRFSDSELMLQAVSLLLPSRDQEAYQPASLPDDPLEADIQYLQLRRSTRYATRGTKTGHGRLELLAVLLLIEAIYRRLGGDWRQVVDQVPEVDQLLPGAGKTDDNRAEGVPTELVSRVLKVVVEIPGSGGSGGLVELGEAIASRGLRRLLPTLPDGFRPEDLIRMAPTLWRGVTRDGELMVVQEPDGGVRMAVSGQQEPSLEVCAVVAGILRGGLRQTGVRSAVEAPACQALGDEACIYQLRWRK